ncbi:hypothetical protein PTKIN_Ptkin09bG0266800 [Pterospermum kingtungense]
MAEGFCSNWLETLGGLASLAYKELALAWGVKEEIEKLEDTVSLIKGVLRDAEDQQRNNNHGVTVWLQQLKDALYDLDDLLDDLSTEALRRKIMNRNEMVKKVRFFFSKSNQLAYSLKMGDRVNAIRQRLDKIANDRAKYHLSDYPVQPLLELRGREQTHSFVVEEEIVGRDDDRWKIIDLLIESKPKDNVSVIPIIGIGGLGKTTLAKMVFNDEKVGEQFQLKMWVCVSEKFELKVIAEKIIEAATGSKPEKDLQMETLQKQLRDIVNGKKYFLVLDDVWNEDRGKWLNLKNLLLGGARGSWIVVTTRSGLVAEITGTVLPHKLEGLSKGQSWSLLKQMAFEKQSQEACNSRLEEIGMEIVEKCKGVPLALRMMGSLVVKRTEAEWLNVKNNVLKYITRQESGILPILKLSYDHLPPHLRQCFAYCSLIPKDTVIKVTEMIVVGMAQGFIQAQRGDEDLEDVGHEYFMDLLQRSFLQVAAEDDSGNVESFTMHDLMHDLACSVAGTEYYIASLNAENVSERTRHVSFMDSSGEIPSTLFRAKRLRTFLQGGVLNVSTYNAYMPNFKYLRVLDLSDVGIERVPNSVGKLKHLRTLDLSRNKYIKKLPKSLCRLQNLQTLFLRGCEELEKLPRKTRRLVSLRYLDIEGCDRLAHMPRGLGQLTCLRMLNKFVVGRRGREVGELRELNELNNIQGEIVISSLQNAVAEPGSAYLKQKVNLKSLVLRWDEVNNEEDDVMNGKYESVFEGLQPHPNLEKLKVDGYPGRKISSWLFSITNLTELTLEDCVKCKHLPPLHQLYSLKSLYLSGLEALENVSEIEKQRELSSSRSTTILPSLERLELRDCPNLKGWWRGDVEEASNAHELPYFPCLSDLTIRRCRNLASMPAFPSVRVLEFYQTSWKPVQLTMKLKMTTSETPSSYSSSSSSSLLPPFSKLMEMTLSEMEDIDSLPEELLQNLTSLGYLSITSCRNLISMPKGMHCLTSLQRLKISDCPQLSERCQRDIGTDWPNITCIEEIRIDDKLI